MTQAATPLYSLAVRTIDGKDTTLEGYRGQVLLVVNVASKCVFTPQYTSLEQLHQQYQEQGLRVLGFPCDQFGHQEPGTDHDIQTFCSTSYGVTFPMFAKLEVNGENAHPLYEHLKQQQTGWFGSSAIKWNFTKFLVERDGTVSARFAPQARPSALNKRIERALGMRR